MNPFSEIGKNFAINHNVSFNVYDAITHKLKRHHEGHNAVTNSMLMGIGHYLLGDGTLNQGWDMLHTWIPKYISLGTMGLRSQNCDENGLPTDLGSIQYEDGEEPNFEADCIDYMNKVPGFGADGYDEKTNNGRAWFGLGPRFTDRLNNGWFKESFNGQDEEYRDKTEFTLKHKISIVYVDGKSTEPKVYMNLDYNNPLKLNEDYTYRTPTGCNYSIIQLLSGSLEISDILEIEYYDDNKFLSKSIDCELISPSFQRIPISYRTIIPEIDSEIPKTIDIVFSAMISTGALKQFRDYLTVDGETVQNDYVFITEAGLWSSREYQTRIDSETGKEIPSGGGMLAGYRIAPPNKDNWDMTVEENRNLLRQSILRVGYNEVVQVVWKIQLGSVEDYGGWQNIERRLHWVEMIKHPWKWKDQPTQDWPGWFGCNDPVPHNNIQTWDDSRIPHNT